MVGLVKMGAEHGFLALYFRILVQFHSDSRPYLDNHNYFHAAGKLGSSFRSTLPYVVVVEVVVDVTILLLLVLLLLLLLLLLLFVVVVDEVEVTC